MANVTHPKNEERNMQNAPKKCLNFVLAYSKSYKVIAFKNGAQVGINLN